MSCGRFAWCTVTSPWTAERQTVSFHSRSFSRVVAQNVPDVMRLLNINTTPLPDALVGGGSFLPALHRGT